MCLYKQKPFCPGTGNTQQNFTSQTLNYVSIINRLSHMKRKSVPNINIIFRSWWLFYFCLVFVCVSLVFALFLDAVQHNLRAVFCSLEGGCLTQRKRRRIHEVCRVCHWAIDIPLHLLSWRGAHRPHQFSMFLERKSTIGLCPQGLVDTSFFI